LSEPVRLAADTPFAKGRELAVRVLANDKSKCELYLDDGLGTSLDSKGNVSVKRVTRALSLAMLIAARPLDAAEPIPRNQIITKKKISPKQELRRLKRFLAGWQILELFLFLCQKTEV
jgi:hypothetical protein